jgi:hypothetical protein
MKKIILAAAMMTLVVSSCNGNKERLKKQLIKLKIK